MDRRRRKCNNCSRPGHTERACPDPVTSFGVVAYHGQRDPRFLLIERRNSIAFVEFAHGRYALDNVQYIKLLFSQMTVDELCMIHGTADYASIVEKVRGTAPRLPPYYGGGRLRFEVMKNGYFTSSGLLVTANSLIESVRPLVERTSVWELPKGRRLCNESALTCAMRELGEETSIDRRHFRISSSQDSLKEEFVSYNGISYRSVFYVAECIMGADLVAATEASFVQNREVSRIRWASLDEARALLSRDSLVAIVEHAASMLAQ